MFEELKKINSRPDAYQYYTAEKLWTNEYTAKKMLKYHLNDSIDASSRNIKFIEKSVQWIASHFEIKDKRIADFGCGPGLYTTRLAKHGAHVTGIDFSKNSLAYAEKTAVEKGLSIQYIHANYLEFETDEKFDIIIMIMCDFCALSPEQRQTLLSKFHSLLKPGGSLLLDVYSMNRFNQIQENSFYELNQLYGFWSPDDYYTFVNTFKYDKEKVTLDKYTIIEKSKTREVYNWLQHFSKESITDEFENAGLKISEVYSDVAGAEFDNESLEFAVVAEKV